MKQEKQVDYGKISSVIDECITLFFKRCGSVNVEKVNCKIKSFGKAGVSMFISYTPKRCSTERRLYSGEVSWILIVQGYVNGKEVECFSEWMLHCEEASSTRRSLWRSCSGKPLSATLDSLNGCEIITYGKLKG